MNEKPDFVIAGAAKCGTTALFEYLRSHPRIFIPRIKEPKFFCSDLKTTGGVYTLDEYRSLFSLAPADCLTGEASTLYLYSKVALKRIVAHNPNTKVIVMLRDPVDAAHALHTAGWSHRLENIESFEDAWRAQTDRLAGNCMPPGWPDPVTLQYGPMYRYAEQIRRLFEHVPPEQRQVVVFEEFFADPAQHHRRLLEFLEVAPDAIRDYPVVNPAMGFRSQRLERWLRQPPPWLRSVYESLRPAWRAMRIQPARLIRGLNSIPHDKPPLRPAFRAEVERYFAPDIAELEDLLGRRLWRSPA
jgi:Sulfotransferase domain